MRWPQTTRWWWRDAQISRKRLAVWFPAVKSPLYLTNNLPGGQLSHVLWRWPVDLLSPKKKKKKEKRISNISWLVKNDDVGKMWLQHPHNTNLVCCHLPLFLPSTSRLIVSPAPSFYLIHPVSGNPSYLLAPQLDDAPKTLGTYSPTNSTKAKQLPRPLISKLLLLHESHSFGNHKIAQRSFINIVGFMSPSKDRHHHRHLCNQAGSSPVLYQISADLS